MTEITMFNEKKPTENGNLIRLGQTETNKILQKMTYEI